jgi:hypothetical protein
MDRPSNLAAWTKGFVHKTESEWSLVIYRLMCVHFVAACTQCRSYPHSRKVCELCFRPIADGLLSAGLILMILTDLMNEAVDVRGSAANPLT